MISRREFLTAVAAAGFTLSFTAEQLDSPAMPANTSAPSPDGGIDFNGELGGVYITPTEARLGSHAEVWIRHPDGSVLMHHVFSQIGGWYWIADLGMHIVGPVNVMCSVKSDILLAGL